MAMPTLILGEALANRCSQVLYRCLEEVGSTKGALYLRTPDQEASVDEATRFLGGDRRPSRPAF